MPKTLYILQPGRIGDAIIALPIAKYYADRGYDVYWPVMHSVWANMRKKADYVTFNPVSDDVLKCIPEAREAIRKEQKNRGDKGELLELAFRFPFTSEVTAKFEAQDKPFDEYKYELAGVPFDEKWNLQLKRDPDNEQFILEGIYSKKSNLRLAHNMPMDEWEYKFNLWHIEGTFNKWEHLEVIKGPVVEISKWTDSVFDWIGALEQATELYLVDSCIANLVNQLNLTNKKYFQTKPEVKTMPVLRGDWIKL